MANQFTRRESARSSRSRVRRDGSSERSVNVFGDEFAVDESLVSDGFRPTTVPDTTRQSTHRPTTPSRSSKPPQNDANKSDAARRWMGAGASQSMPSRNSFTLANDSTDGPSRMSSMHQSDLSRRISTVSSTSTAIPRTQSPFVGASAPSHPYGMYPQDTQLNRASTISSIRSPDRPYNGPSRPTHPYGMYPQETAGEAHESPLASSADITSVGFPGLGQNYARRMGPDGEDADDIIGPDGHTEQLPPYTRFPEGTAIPKERSMGSIAEAYAPSSPQRPNTDHSSDRTLIGAASGPTDPGSERTAAGEEVQGSAPQGSKEKWVEKSKRRTCFGRMPLWAVALILAAVVIIAAVVGGLIGRLLGGNGSHKPPPHPPRPQYSAAVGYGETTSSMRFASLTTTMPDAERLTATPSNLPPLATGRFALPVETTAPGSASACLAQPNQQIAWSCMPVGLMSLDIRMTPDNKSEIMLDTPRPFQAHGAHYGAQMPIMEHPVAMELMQDGKRRELGPAYYFCQDYDKLVILPEGILTPLSTSSSKVKAREESVAKRSLDLRGTVNPGDRPWYCWWNSTYLEGFVYVQQQSNSTGGDISSIIDEINQLATPLPGPDPSATITQAPSVSSEAYRVRRRHHREEDDYGYPYWARKKGSDHNEEEEDDDDSSTDQPSFTYTPYAMPSPPPIFPNVIRLVERQVEVPYKPYCEQMQMLDDRSVNWVTDEASGNRITVMLEEAPDAQKRAVYEHLDKGLQPRGGIDGTGCMCAWESA